MNAEFLSAGSRKYLAIGMRVSALVLVTFFALAGVMWAGAVEHPGVLPSEAECSSCHASKISGKSVHSVMAASCGVCHVTTTKGDMTLMSLSMPKEKICSACHEEAAALSQHVPAVKGTCMECHDAHSSERKMLLRGADRASLSALKRK
jgi:predicted CXXCH cytochrome family protein